MASHHLGRMDRPDRPRRLSATWVPQTLLILLVGGGLGAAALVVPALPRPWGPLVLLAVLAPFVVLIVGHLRQILLAIAILNITISLDRTLGYRESIGNLGGIGGWIVSVGTLALLGLYALWLAARLTGIGHGPRPALRPFVPLLVFLFFNVVSLAVAQDATVSLFEIFWLVQLTLLSLYVASTVSTRGEVLFVITTIMVGLVLESLIMIGLGATHREFEFAGISTRVDSASGVGAGAARVAGTVGSPNSAAAYLSFLLAPALSLTFSRVPPRLRWLGGAAFGLGCVALILTLSRGGLTAFVISLLILGFFALRRGWLSPGTVWAVAGISLTVLALFYSTLAARLLGDDNGAAFARIPLMQIAWKVISDHPLGVGVNNFVAVLPHYVGPQFATDFIYATHNLYLTIWAEIGLGGLAAFLWFLASIIRRAWRCAATLGRDLSPFALGVMAATFGQLFHMFVDVFKGWPQLESLWLMAGLLVAMSLLRDPAPRAAPGTLEATARDAARDTRVAQEVG